jgi:hypothetical protein
MPVGTSGNLKFLIGTCSDPHSETYNSNVLYGTRSR